MHAEVVGIPLVKAVLNSLEALSITFHDVARQHYNADNNDNSNGPAYTMRRDSHCIRVRHISDQESRPPPRRRSRPLVRRAERLEEELVLFLLLFVLTIVV